MSFKWTVYYNWLWMTICFLLLYLIWENEWPSRHVNSRVTMGLFLYRPIFTFYIISYIECFLLPKLNIAFKIVLYFTHIWVSSCWIYTAQNYKSLHMLNSHVILKIRLFSRFYRNRNMVFNVTEKIDYISICIHHDHSNAHHFVQLKKKSGCLCYEAHKFFSFLFKYFMSGFELILVLWYFFFSRNILHVIFYKLILSTRFFFLHVKIKNFAKFVCCSGHR